MANHKCHGVPTDRMDLRLSKIYAEGREARAGGAAKATNPYADTFVDEKAAWDRGYDVATGTADCTARSEATMPAPS